MNIQFEKYHGTGNDFILIDNRLNTFPKEVNTIANICNRRYGVGADGLILIQSHPDFDFEMIYYNSDGRLSSMCGNGGRCAVIFASQLGIICQVASFIATDGVHSAIITDTGNVKLSMLPVSNIRTIENGYVLDTGSPHYVTFVPSVKDLDVVNEGKKIRYNNTYREKGINVNFVQLKNEGLEMRTYERGVEDETLSCGTGTVAAAISASLKMNGKNQQQVYHIKSPGGDLKVSFLKDDPQHFTNIFLEGPVGHVFHGELEI